MVDQLVAQVIGLEVGLLSCQARLAAVTDDEALHDLRTTVRRLRSLLRPLRGLPGVEQLEVAASTVGQLTTPLRDREVLAAYLHQHGHHEAANRRLRLQPEAYRQVAQGPELAHLLLILDAFPRFIRASEHQKLLKGLRPRIEKRLAKQWQTLDKALKDPSHDRHRLRLLIKRVRYAAEAYPELDKLPAKAVSHLKKPRVPWEIGTTAGSGWPRLNTRRICNLVLPYGIAPWPRRRGRRTACWINSALIVSEPVRLLAGIGAVPDWPDG